MEKDTLLIIIPCYNEYLRLNDVEICSFLNNTKRINILFANDASTDNTLDKLNNYAKLFPAKAYVFSELKNSGKGEIIRKAFQYALKSDISFEKVAYIDADLSVSLEECFLLSKQLTNNTPFVFGSRIKKIDNNISRKLWRHLVGRVLATIISQMLQLSVYDTQCGIKIIRKDLAIKLLKESFISKWLFDVEIFFRLKKTYSIELLPSKCREIPLQSWEDVEGSKVKMSYFFKMLFDLNKIYQTYR